MTKIGLFQLKVNNQMNNPFDISVLSPSHRLWSRETGLLKNQTIVMLIHRVIRLTKENVMNILWNSDK